PRNQSNSGNFGFRADKPKTATRCGAKNTAPRATSRVTVSFGGRLMRRLSGMLGALVLLTTGASGLVAQTAQSWQRKWYWGAQSGAFIYKVPGNSNIQFGLDAGVHWLITGKHSAMHVSFDQLILGNNTQSVVFDGSGPTGFRTVTFSGA